MKIGDFDLFFLTRLFAYYELRVPGRTFSNAEWLENLYAAPIMIRTESQLRAFIYWYLYRHKVIKLNSELKVKPKIFRPIELKIEIEESR